MEEDIKVLKEMLKARKEHKKIIEDSGGYCANCDPDIHALEEAINGLSSYKQLEEENRIYVLEGSKARLEMHIKKNYIPVSLVKEKIDDLEKRGYFGEADAMKELLERSREE